MKAKLLGPKYWLAVWLVLLGGCSSTAVIKEATTFSNAGIQYADSVSQLIDYVRDTTINRDSDDLLQLASLIAKAQQGEGAITADVARQRLQKYFTDHDTALAPVVKQMVGLKGQTLILRNYFVNLQALAQFDAAGGTEQAVRSLSEQINGLNKAITGTQGSLISPQEQTAIASLAGLVGKSIQAGKIREAFERDASIIGKQLLLQQKLLKIMGDMLNATYEEQARKAYLKDVQRPYMNASIGSDNSWKQARLAGFNATFLSEQLRVASSAAQNMQSVWRGIVSGEGDPQAIQSMLADISGFLSAIDAVKTASKQQN